MQGLASIKPPGSREAAALLSDAANYLQDVVATGTGDAAAGTSAAAGVDETMRAAAAEALQACQAALAQQQ